MLTPVVAPGNKFRYGRLWVLALVWIVTSGVNVGAVGCCFFWKINWFTFVFLLCLLCLCSVFLLLCTEVSSAYLIAVAAGFFPLLLRSTVLGLQMGKYDYWLAGTGYTFLDYRFIYRSTCSLSIAIHGDGTSSTPILPFWATISVALQYGYHLYTSLQ